MSSLPVGVRGISLDALTDVETPFGLVELAFENGQVELIANDLT